MISRKYEDKSNVAGKVIKKGGNTYAKIKTRNKKSKKRRKRYYIN